MNRNKEYKQGVGNKSIILMVILKSQHYIFHIKIMSMEQII